MKATYSKNLESNPNYYDYVGKKISSTKKDKFKDKDYKDITYKKQIDSYKITRENKQKEFIKVNNCIPKNDLLDQGYSFYKLDIPEIKDVYGKIYIENKYLPKIKEHQEKLNKLKHNGYSLAEKEIKDFIQENYNGTIIENDRKVISPKEIDIYLPDLKFGIEFNGDYWHSAKWKDLGEHQAKALECMSKGILLYQIWEHEWINDKEKVKDIIIDTICGTYRNIIKRSGKFGKYVIGDLNKPLTNFDYIVDILPVNEKCYNKITYYPCSKIIYKLKDIPENDTLSQLKKEKMDLDSKIFAIERFNTSKKFNEVSGKQRDGLRAQLSAMKAYEKALTTRISDLEENK